MDLNGDGAGDLIVGAPQFADQDPGYIAIYFGSREEASRIRLKPHDPPIVIPPEGGSFRYDLDFINESNATRTIDIWVALNGPGLQRTLLSLSRTLAPGARFHRTLHSNDPRQCVSGDVYCCRQCWHVSYARGE
jgi:FG-GAP repeat